MNQDHPQQDAAQRADARGGPEREAENGPRSRAGSAKPGDLRFRKRERLRLRRDYNRVFERKCSAADNLLVVYVAPNGLAWSRLGLSVNKRIGKAVTRNAVRRQIREAFRACKTHIPTGLDIVCIARPGAREETVDNVRTSIVRLTHRAGQRLTATSRDKCEPARRRR